MNSMKQRDYFLNKRYFDDSRFPYGFSRSGDFTINESKVLETKGSYFRALESDSILNPTEDEIRVSKVFRGELEASSFEEKTWMKYAKCKKKYKIGLRDSIDKGEKISAHQLDISSDIDNLDEIKDYEEDFID